MLAFFGQISEIWRLFKLVGPTNFIWPYPGIFSSWLALKIRLTFWIFCCKRFLCRKKFTVLLFRQHFYKVFVINATLDRRPRSNVSKICGIRDSKYFFCVNTGSACAVVCYN